MFRAPPSNTRPLQQQLLSALRVGHRVNEATKYSGLQGIGAAAASAAAPVSNAERKAFVKARLHQEYTALKARIGQLTPEEVLRMRNLNKGIQNLSGGTRKRKNRKSRKEKKRSTRRH